MNIKKITLGLIVAALAAPGLLVVRAGGEDAPKPEAVEVLRQPLKETVDGKPARVTLVEVRLAPGASGSPHRHPGPVVGYVLQGEVEIQVGDGPVRTYRRGETFFEPARALHKLSRNPSPTEPARFLAYLLTGDDVESLVLPPE